MNWIEWFFGNLLWDKLKEVLNPKKAELSEEERQEELFVPSYLR